MGQPALMSDWTHLFKVNGWPAAQQQQVRDAISILVRGSVHPHRLPSSLNVARCLRATLHTAPHAQVLDAVRHFQDDLAQCADDVESANMLREARGERKFVAFNPRILETSVSI